MKVIIISASRRTDIPAFYSQWFLNRIREGFCTVFNPFNRHQVRKVSLLPSDVDVIVFWTKNAKPLINHLDELNERGFRYYLQYTVNGYPSDFEPNIPHLDTSLETFRRLAGKLGSEKVIWRYDPIFISNITGYDYHYKQFERIAKSLRGETRRVVISIGDEYRKSVKKFKDLKTRGIDLIHDHNSSEIKALVKSLASIAVKNEMEIVSCAESWDLESTGVLPGKCIDDQYIRRVFGIDVTRAKDKSQRPECGCISSKDIGSYDSCQYGCVYCYAGTLKMSDRINHRHYNDSPSLIGRYDV